MRIGIDARLWNETGVGRYIRNLVLALSKLDKKNQYSLFVTPQALQADFFAFTQKKDSKWKLIATDIPWHTVEEQMLFYKVLESEQLDLVHFPYFSIPILYNRPYVFTIHDLIINHFPTGKASKLPFPVYYIKRFGYQMVLKQAARNARKIIAVSHATKKEILDHLPVAEKKIEVTYEGVDKNLYTSNERSDSRNLPTNSGLRLDDKYFLYVGNAYPHKNVERLIEAFDLVRKKSPQTKLVLVGQQNYFYQRLEEKVKKLDMSDHVTFTGAANDKQLKALYSNAEALVFPSLMEGFGLPGLEAMQSKCLVIASDIPVFKEIYDDAVLYFNPLDIKQLNDTMQKVLSDKKKFAPLIQKGYQQVAKYSWEKMAKETLNVYENSISLR